MSATMIACLLTLFFPGVVATRDKVFYDSEVRAKLPAPASAALKGYEDRKLKLSESIAGIQKNLDSVTQVSQQGDLHFYAELLKEKREEAAQLAPPAYAIGFFLSPQMLLWPAIYAALGSLLVCFPNSKRHPLHAVARWRTLLLGAFIYLYYEWPLWTRNLLLGSNGRTVYAYTNYDIDVWSFLTQEVTIAGFSFLIASVWVRWLDHAAFPENDLPIEPDTTYLNPRIVFHFQREFYRWIVASFMLGLGFIYFTTFFWSLVARYHDERYIVSAFLAHSLWALTWVFLSVPLVKCWNELKARKLSAIARLMEINQATPGKSEQLDLDSLEKLESIAGIRISIAGVGAIISLALPILQLFLHKG
jgi:hypothetical protein